MQLKKEIYKLQKPQPAQAKQLGLKHYKLVDCQHSLSQSSTTVPSSIENTCVVTQCFHPVLL